MKKNKKILMGVLTVALAAVLVIGASLAFLTDEAVATNKFTIGDIDIDIDEPGWTPEDGEDYQAGDTKVKDPTVKGIKGDSYARVIVKLIDQNETVPNPDYVDDDTTPDEPKTIANPNKGEVITDAARIAAILNIIYNDPNGNIDVNESYALADVAAYLGFNTTDFTLDNTYGSASELYYNYTAADGILSESEEATLFTHIVIPTDYTNTELQLMGNFDIDVVAQAIQTTGFDTAAAAYAALDAELS